MTENSNLCPNCQIHSIVKVIYFGLPGQLCEYCNYFDGLASYAPLVTSEDEYGEPCFSFIVYEGSYWKALFYWLFRSKIK